MVDPAHVTECLQMLHFVAGSEAKWRERPFVSQSNCFVVPPMKFAEDACRCLETAARGGMPVLLLSAAQAGATSPAALAGTLVQAVAECLFGLVYQLRCSRSRCHLGAMAFVSTCAPRHVRRLGEQALITSGLCPDGTFLQSYGGVCRWHVRFKIAGYAGRL
jgi:trimethylamine--corrinoid protein Co-methyltransferase